MNIPANNPALQSWVTIPPHSDFPIQNLPFGIFRTAQTEARVGVRIGDSVLDLWACSQAGFLEGLTLDFSVLAQPYLNGLMAQGRTQVRELRNRISRLLATDSEFDLRLRPDSFLYPLETVTVQMPVRIGNYTDFYSSLDHATNMGKMFRDVNNPLLPNWKHIPVGYHGRASSIVLSGVPLHRPKGQLMPEGAEVPIFSATKMLDFELEMAFLIGKETALGTSVRTQEADEYIFGFVLFNDWSARDMQRWEYVPLGPFLSKNFGSSISAWVVTLDALEPFRVAGAPQDVPVLPYLHFEGNWHFDIQLEVWLQPANSEETLISRSNYRHLYWNIAQHLAHHTVNGCNIEVGDMLASGTISGSTPDSFGSMIELTWKGTKPIELKDKTLRRQIEDGDTVIMRAYGVRDQLRVGFGEVRTTILPARSN